MKQCRTCGDRLPLDSFYAHPATADRYLNHCKECVKSRMRQYQRGNPIVAERDRKRDENRREQTRKHKHRWDQKNQHKRRAQRKAHYAIRRGELTREPCEVCGATKSEAHHEDYDRPLDVRWLCRKHHAEVHRITA